MLDETISRVRRPSDDGDDAGQTVLVLLAECDRMAVGSARYDLGEIDEVTVGRGEHRVVARRGRTLAITIPDGRMSRQHATLRRVDGAWTIEDAGSRNGTVVNGETRPRAELLDGDLIETGHTAWLLRQRPVADELPADCDTAVLAAQLPHVTSFAPALVRALRELPRVVKANISVMVRGETGTGKEAIARAVHAMSGRTGRFVAVNCGALPATLIEAELFGHKKGAFTGATADKLGHVRAAHQGTLFLDEIGDLSPSSQAALLRMLQEREVTPIGTSEPVSVDVLVVSATHRELEVMPDDQFRRDLYARLASYTVVVPPLRERREDLGLLAQILLARITAGAALPALAVETMRQLVAYDWPLNVRELESALRVATALVVDGVIAPAQLPPALAAVELAPHPDAASAAALSPEDQRRRAHLLELLRAHKGNISAVSRAMGKARVQIQRWLRRFGIDAESFKMLPPT